MISHLPGEMVLMNHQLLHTLGNEGMSRSVESLESLESLNLLRLNLSVRRVCLRRVRHTIICVELPGEGQLSLPFMPLESVKSHVHYVSE